MWRCAPCFHGRGKLIWPHNTLPSRSPHSGGTALWLHIMCLIVPPSGENSIWLASTVGENLNRDTTIAFFSVYIVGRVQNGYMAIQPRPSWGTNCGEQLKWRYNLLLLRVPMVVSSMWRHKPRFPGVTQGQIDQYGDTTPAPWGPQSGERSIWRCTPYHLGVPVMERDPSGDMTLGFPGSS